MSSHDTGVPVFSAAQAYWKHRFTLAESKDLLRSFAAATGDPISLTPYQSAQLMAAVLEYQPDLILELGRGAGNSTCVFTEAAHRLTQRQTRVLSLDTWEGWEQHTVPRLRACVPDSWFLPLQALRQDILTFDFEAALSGAQRVAVFWDAHGFDVAECILGTVLPALANRNHLVLIHDLCDGRYEAPDSVRYGEHGLWRGADLSGPRIKLGIIDSWTEEAISILDFSTRNRLPLHSSDHSFHAEIGSDPARLSDMTELLGELFSLRGYWFWLSLNDGSPPYTFPKRRRRSRSELLRTLAQREPEVARLCEELSAAENEIRRLSDELHAREGEISSMKSSKFWKLRTRWFAVKRLVGLDR